MVNLTYALVVLAVLALLGVGAVRRTGASGKTSGPASVVAKIRTVRDFVAGTEPASADLVRRLSGVVETATQTFGNSYAVPSYVGAVLVPTTFAAATAAKAQVIAETEERLIADMTSRAARAGTVFELPSGYKLNLAMSCGPKEALFASFTPIIDVQAQARQLGLLGAARPAPGPQDAPTSILGGGQDPMTAVRRGTVNKLTIAVLLLDGVEYARATMQQGEGATLLVGRGREADLVCAEDISDLSRIHAALVRVDGTLYLEDRNSTNGTWMQKAGLEPLPLARGARVEFKDGDLAWLDEDCRLQISVR